MHSQHPSDGGPLPRFDDPAPTVADAQPTGDSTWTDLQPAATDPTLFGITRRRLIKNYRALIRSRAIYHPVGYRFLREYGRGRQGIVFLGLRQGARGCITRHAIKIYDPGIYTTAARYWADMGRIAYQISRLQSVHSPALASRDSYEEANGVGYVQMEAIEGVNLRYLLSLKHLAPARAHSTREEWAHFTDVIFRLENDRLSIQPGVAVYILRRILRGLETLHESGFVHGDVKPANTMIDQLGYVKLIDYGRAVRINEKPNILLGTPYYMSPETHRRERAHPQADLYSVGLLGIEMLTGRQMIPARSEAELLQFKLALPDRLPEILPRHVQESDLLTSLLRGLIHPDPEQRSAFIGEAERVEQAFGILQRELVRMDVDADYGRELETYLARIRKSDAKQVELS